MPRDTIVEPVIAAELEAVPSGAAEQPTAARRRGAIAAMRRRLSFIGTSLSNSRARRIGDAASSLLPQKTLEARLFLGMPWRVRL
jgi:hypothetical protein